MPPTANSSYGTQERPGFVKVAVVLIVFDALFGAVSADLLFRISPTNRGWTLPFQPGVWVVALLQVLFAAFLWRGKNWVRYLLAAWVVSLLVETVFFTSLSARFEHFPLATARDLLSFALLAASALLVFMPVSSPWFKPMSKPGDA